MNKPKAATVMTVFIMLVGVGVTVGTASTALAAPSGLEYCNLVANVPKRNARYADFSGGREGCADSEQVTVRAKRDVSGWFDSVLSEISFDARNDVRSLSVYGTEGHVYFTETEGTNGGKNVSGRMTF